jgi:thioredoxin 1
MSIVHINDSNFEKEVVESNIPVILDFWAEWCGPCQMMGPVFEELSKEYEGKLKFVKVNTEDNPNLSMKFNITGIPALIIAKQGKEINRLVGFMPKAVLKQKINEFL